MILPITKMVFPASLTTAKNGQIPASNLVVINQWGSLYVTAARAWNALVHDAAQIGLPLTFTFGGMYRSFAQQERLFFSRYKPGYVASAKSNKQYQGKWWHLTSGAIAAVPGTSNHGWGLAIDMAYDPDGSDGIYPDDATYIVSHPQWPWLHANVVNYGFSFELQSEPWHVRYVMGDIIPIAVQNYEAGVNTGVVTPVPTPVPTSPPTKESSEVAVTPATIKVGSTGGWVKKCQAILNVNFGQATLVTTFDGQFGPKTDQAVKNVQAFFGLTVDGIVGPKTWDILFNIAP